VYQALTNHSFALSRQLNENDEAIYSHHGWPVVGETWGGMNTDIHDFKSTLSHDQVIEALANTRKKIGALLVGQMDSFACRAHQDHSRNP
jgi:hypothetical protein